MNIDDDGNEWYEYQIVEGDSAATLESAVNEKITEGFHPLGGPAFDGGVYLQAMWNGDWPVYKTS